MENEMDFIQHIVCIYEILKLLKLREDFWEEQQRHAILEWQTLVDSRAQEGLKKLKYGRWERKWPIVSLYQPS